MEAVSDFLNNFNTTQIARMFDNITLEHLRDRINGLDPEVFADKVAAFPSKEASLVLHAFAAVLMVRSFIAPYKPHWLLHLVMYLVVTRAAETVRGLLLGKPIGWLADDAAVRLYIAVWWTANYFPLDLVYKIVSFPAVSVFIVGFDQMIRVSAIRATIDATVAVFPNSIVAPILVGTFVGQSAVLVRDLFKWAMGDDKAVTQLSNPGWPIRSAAYMAVTYVLIVDPAGQIWPANSTARVPPEFVIAAFKLLMFFVSIFQFAIPSAPLPFDFLEFIAVRTLGLHAPNFAKGAAVSKTGAKVASQIEKKKAASASGSPQISAASKKSK